jgi:hypothetical protein
MDDGDMGLMPGTTGNLDPSSAYPFAGSTGIAGGTGTGQHGITSMFSGGEGTIGDAIMDVWEWLNTPFNKPMSAMTIFAITGSILIAIIVWNLILYHIRIAAEAI